MIRKQRAFGALAIPGLAILLYQAPAVGQQMQFVGAPNIFDQNGHVNTQLYSNLPNAFNWHPYQPGVAPQVGNGQAPPPAVQIIPPGGQGGQSYPIIQYDTNGYYGAGYSGWGNGFGNGYSNGYGNGHTTIDPGCKPDHLGFRGSGSGGFSCGNGFSDLRFEWKPRKSFDRCLRYHLLRAFAGRLEHEPDMESFRS